MRSIAVDYKGPKGAPAVVCDFDNTIVIENIGELLLEHFAADGWRNFQRLHAQKLITLKEYQEQAFLTVKVDQETMKALVREKATLRPHFKSLWQYCQRMCIPLAIVSLGLDFYIEALLEREGMESIPFFAVDTEFTSQGISFGYRFAWGGCWQPGNCKCRTLEQYHRLGHTILYAGDGKSDICPATRSDVVFARSYLEEHFQEKGLNYVQLTDFSKVLDTLKDLSTPSAGETHR